MDEHPGHVLLGGEGDAGLRAGHDRRRPHRCTRRGGGSILTVFCTASWTDGKRHRYDGSFRMALNEDGTIAARFDGRRATLGCLGRRRGKQAKRCHRGYRFSVSVG